MNNFIGKIHCRARWNIIDDIKENLDKLEQKYERSPLYFSASAPEYINIILPVAGGVVTTLVGIFVAYVQRGKKIRIVFDGGSIKEIDASNYDTDELINAISKIKTIDITD